uniref:Uncharacterized protein n=1 Tax=Anopheles atroparvus TaxID=41427 RepID=A0AAG5DDL0_ANOAO
MRMCKLLGLNHKMVEQNRQILSKTLVTFTKQLFQRQHTTFDMNFVRYLIR